MSRPCPAVGSFALVIGLISAFSASAEAVSPRWLLTDPGAAVSAANGYEARAADGIWTIKDPRDPNLMLAPVDIAADREKYLLLDLDNSSRVRLQVFFAADQRAFGEDRSFQPTRPLRAGRHLYEIPLTPLSSWSGTIRDLRLDLEQAKAGDHIVVHRLGVAERPLPQGDANVVRLVLSTPPAPGEPVRMERMAAWHKTVAVTDEVVPNSAVFTYLVDRFGYTENNGLAKLSPVVTSTDKSLGRITSVEAQDVHVEDTPGGVRATFRLEGTRVRTEIVPLFIGRGSKAVEGVALYRINTEPATAVQVQIGGGKSFTLIGGSGTAGLRSEDLLPLEGLRVDGGIAQFRGGLESLPVAIGGSAALATTANEPLTVSFPAGKGHLVIAFAREPARAAELVKIDADAEAKRVAEYYDRLWAANRIETPEQVMNDAFRHALRTMEYTWIEPYGWLECVHHWFSLWHMQATAGAEWVGQSDRSQLCTSTHAQMLTPEGAVPQLSPGGQTHRDFGGSNQFWSWQARHYWQLTGDKAFVARIAPALDKVLEQTFREYDKDKNLLLGWGLQIGNQEGLCRHTLRRHNAQHRRHQHDAHAGGVRASAGRCEDGGGVGAAGGTRSITLARAAVDAGVGKIRVFRRPTRESTAGRAVPCVALPGHLGCCRSAGRVHHAASRARATHRPRRRGVLLKQLPQPRRRHMGHAGGRSPTAMGGVGILQGGSVRMDLPAVASGGTVGHGRQPSRRLARGSH